MKEIELLENLFGILRSTFHLIDMLIDFGGNNAAILLQNRIIGHKTDSFPVQADIDLIDMYDLFIR